MKVLNKGWTAQSIDFMLYGYGINLLNHLNPEGVACGPPAAPLLIAFD